MANITLDQVLAEWKVDARVDESNVGKELFRTANLHAKYLEYYVSFKAKLAGEEKRHNKLMWVKRKYWRGELEQKDLTKYGWSQWQGLKPSASELNQLFEMDNDLNDLKEKISAYKTAVSTLEYIMKSLTGRDYTLKTVVEYQKFINGS